MATGREGAAAAPVTLGGVPGVLAVGGYSGTGYLATAEFYDPFTMTWSPVASMSIARYGTAAAAVTRAGVVGVLVTGGQDPAFVASAEFYDPSTSSWSPVAPMSTARAWHGTAPVTIGGVDGVLAVGGYGGPGYLASAEFYDPTTNTWTAVASMASGRRRFGAAAVTIGGITGVLAAGGYSSTYLSAVEFYDPAANSWSPAPSMPAPRIFFGAAPVGPQGAEVVVVVGGDSGGGPLATGLRFCP